MEVCLMAQVVKAIYHAGQLQLLSHVDLSEGQEVTVTIDHFERNTPSVEHELERLRERLHEEEYPGEQEETLDLLKEVLDEDRLSNRKLFP